MFCAKIPFKIEIAKCQCLSSYLKYVVIPILDIVR